MKNQKVKEYLDVVGEQIAFKEARRGVQKELLSHIEEHLEVAKSYGVSEATAVAESLRRMGNAKELGLSLNQVHKSKVDFLVISLAGLLITAGLGSLSTSGLVGLQSLWTIIGTVLAGAILLSSYQVLMKILSSLYVVAVVGLIAAQFSGVSVEGQPYLSLIGLKIKMIDLAALLMAVSLPATMEISREQKVENILTPMLILAPLIYFSFIGSVFPAGILLIGGVIGASHLKNHWIPVAIGALGVLAISIFASNPFLNPEQLKAAITDEAHTDFALSALIQSSQIGAIIVIALFATFLVHTSLRASSIKSQWLRTTAISCVAIFGVEILFGLTSNYGFVPMFKTGANIPFLSYGGSLIVAHLLMVGVVLACLRRRAVSYS